MSLAPTLDFAAHFKWLLAHPLKCLFHGSRFERRQYCCSVRLVLACYPDPLRIKFQTHALVTELLLRLRNLFEIDLTCVIWGSLEPSAPSERGLRSLSGWPPILRRYLSVGLETSALVSPCSWIPPPPRWPVTSLRSPSRSSFLGKASFELAACDPALHATTKLTDTDYISQHGHLLPVPGSSCTATARRRFLCVFTQETGTSLQLPPTARQKCRCSTPL